MISDMKIKRMAAERNISHQKTQGEITKRRKTNDLYKNQSMYQVLRHCHTSDQDRRGSSTLPETVEYMETMAVMASLLVKMEPTDKMPQHPKAELKERIITSIFTRYKDMKDTWKYSYWRQLVTNSPIVVNLNTHSSKSFNLSISAVKEAKGETVGMVDTAETVLVGIRVVTPRVTPLVATEAQGETGEMEDREHPVPTEYEGVMSRIYLMKKIPIYSCEPMELIQPKDGTVQIHVKRQDGQAEIYN